MPSSGQMQAAESNSAAGQRATNAQQPAGGNLNTVRTVPNNLHNLGAMPAQTSPADPNVVVTTHHTFAGNQVRKHTALKKVFFVQKVNFTKNFNCLFTFSIQNSAVYLPYQSPN